MLHSPEVGAHFVCQTGEPVQQFGVVPEQFGILRSQGAFSRKILAPCKSHSAIFRLRKGARSPLSFPVLRHDQIHNDRSKKNNCNAVLSENGADNIRENIEHIRNLGKAQTNA